MTKTRKRLAASFGIAVLLLVCSACSVQTSSKNGGNGKDVKISTAFGNLKVDADAKNPPDTGMPVYPGSKAKPGKDEHDSGSANVNISSPFFGVKVAAATYTSDDTQSKVVDFYRNELKKFGPVVECKGEIAENKDSGDLYCSDRDGRALQLGVGNKEHRRIVAFKDVDKGTEFSLVNVQVRGKEGAL